MSNAKSIKFLVLYLIVCAAPPAQQTLHVVTPLQKVGWMCVSSRLPG